MNNMINPKYTINILLLTVLIILRSRDVWYYVQLSTAQFHIMANWESLSGVLRALWQKCAAHSNAPSSAINQFFLQC